MNETLNRRKHDGTVGLSANRIEWLDALRGIAVIMVVAMHSGDHARGHGVPLFDEIIWPVLRHGYLGVQLFFVLSGYCILGAVDSAMRAPKPFSTYIQRRLRRIFPPYWFSLLLAIGLGLLTVAITKRSWSQVFPLTGSDWLLNVVLLQGPFAAPDAVMVYWSLSIEVQFYFIMALCLAFPRWRSAWLIGLSALYTFWSWQSFFPIAGTPMAYWPEFACGIGAYVAHNPRGFMRGTHWCLWGLAVAAVLIGWNHTTTVISRDGEFVTCIKQLFCIGCGLLIWQLRKFNLVIERNPIIKLLSVVGVFSYSLYLTHVPIGTRVFNLAGRFSQLNGISWYAVAMIATVVQFAGGWFFYWYCERSWLNQKGGSRLPTENMPNSTLKPLEAVLT